MGDFRDEKQTGLGVFIHGDGVRYEGRFLDSRYHGKGILLVAGKKYKGDFRKGKKKVLGRLTLRMAVHTKESGRQER